MRERIGKKHRALVFFTHPTSQQRECTQHSRRDSQRDRDRAFKAKKMSTANSNKKVALQTPERSQKAQTTTTTTEVQGRHHHHLRQAFASRFGFLSNASKRKPETELLVCKHERVAREKRDPDLDQLQSRSLFSSLLFSSLLLLSRLQAAQRSSSRLRSARTGNQRTAVPAPPVLGTRERPCPFRPCRGPESGRHGGTGPFRRAPRGKPGRISGVHSLTYLLTRESFLFSFFLFSFFFLFFNNYK